MVEIRIVEGGRKEISKHKSGLIVKLEAIGIPRRE